MNHPNQNLFLIISDFDKTPTDRKIQDAAQLYAEQCGIDLSEEALRVERTERGKPYFPECPQIKVSVSHSGAFFVCAVSDTEVGVDLQQHTTMKEETETEAVQRFQSMARRYFHEEEAGFLENAAFADFFKLWTAKESYVKYTGQGMDSHYKEFNVLPQDTTLLAAQYELYRPVRWNAMDLCFTQFLLEPDYTLSVCTSAQKGIAILNSI